MIRVAVLVPVLGRPQRALPLAQSLAATVTGPIFDAFVMFLCSPGDDEQIAACDEAARRVLGTNRIIVHDAPGPGDYARKINLGARLAAEPSHGCDFVLLGADDLVFHPGWLEAAMVAQLQTGACVVGTNDLGNRAVMAGRHATHPLVHVAYLEGGVIDRPDALGLLHEGYGHSYVDTEFIGTAQSRATFTHATDSHVEHLHPLWGKSDDDPTYRKGQRTFAADRAHYEARRSLWERVERV